MADRASHGLRFDSASYAGGWTVPELLVVISIIAILLGLTVPAVMNARSRSRTLACQVNLRDLGQALHAYAGANRGWMYPVERNSKSGKVRLAFGSTYPPNERWPAIVFKLPASGAPLPFNPAAYTEHPYDPAGFPARPFTPPNLTCPADDEPYEAHTYVLNGHLGERSFRLGDKDSAGVNNGAVILAGEKRTQERDYFMQRADFDRVVEPFRHGKTQGSNYLFLDGHVETQPPREVKLGLDAWDVKRPR